MFRLQRHKMAITNINSEDRLVQETFAAHLEQQLGWDSVYAYNDKTFGADGTLGRKDIITAVLIHNRERIGRGRVGLV